MRTRSSRAVFGIVSVVVGLGAACWWWWPSSSVAPLVGESVGGVAGLAEAGHVDAARGAGESAVAAAAPTSNGERRAAADVVDAAAASGGDMADIAITVRVVDGRTDAPVPGATLRFWDAAAEVAYVALPEHEQEPTWNDEERRIRQFGRLAICDEQGCASLRVAAGMDVIAEHDGAYGAVRIEAGVAAPTAGHRIPILRDLSLAVRVLTAAGAPAEELMVAIDTADAAGAPTRTLHYFVTTTDAAGLATLAHLQWPRDEDPALTTLSSPLCVFVDQPGCRECRAEFVMAALPAAPLELRLPPCGRVVVRAPPGAGTERISVALALAEGATGERAREASMRRGMAEFDHVPVGGRYKLGALTTGWNATFDGPRFAGDVVDVQLVDAPQAVVLVGRVSGADGKPIVDRGVMLELELELDEMDPFAVPPVHRLVAVDSTTDADGRFELRGRELVAGKRVRRGTLRIGEPWQRTALRAAFGERSLQAGRNELGEIAVHEAPLLVAGQLLHAGAVFKVPAPPIVEVATTTAAGGSEWHVVPDLLCDGIYRERFEVRGVAPAERLRVHFGNTLLLVDGPAEFTPGRADLLLAVEPLVEFVATLQLDASLPLHLNVDLQPKQVAPPLLALLQSQRSPLRATLERVGDRVVGTFWSVPSGNYRLSVELPGFPQPLLVVDDVTVAPGRVDPRARDLDLRGRVAMLDVHVHSEQDPNGEELDARVAALGASEVPYGRFWQVRVDQRMLVPSGPVDLVVFDHDHEPVELRAVSGRVDVRMRPWRATELVVVGAPPLPEGLCYELLAWNQPGSRPDWKQLATFRSAWGGQQRLVDGRARIAFGEGPAQLTLHVRRSSDHRVVEVPGVAPASVRASDTPLEVRVPAAAVAAAVAALQGEAPR